MNYGVPLFKKKREKMTWYTTQYNGKDYRIAKMTVLEIQHEIQKIWYYMGITPTVIIKIKTKQHDTSSTMDD